nr:hypothetical protein [Herbidospora sakaeratensis]
MTTSGPSATWSEVASASAPMAGVTRPPTLTARPRVIPLAVPTREGR